MGANEIVDLIFLGGIFATLALPVAVIVIAVLVCLNRKRAASIRMLLQRVDQLKRRNADLEALRGNVSVAVTVDDATIPVAEAVARAEATKDVRREVTPATRRPLHGGRPT